MGSCVLFILSFTIFGLSQYGFWMDRLDAMQHTLLTFGSLTFMVISRYLPQLLKLKIAGIELEKSAVDQIKVTGSLGISK